MPEEDTDPHPQAQLFVERGENLASVVLDRLLMWCQLWGGAGCPSAAWHVGPWGPWEVAGQRWPAGS